MILSSADIPMRNQQNTLCTQYQLNDLFTLPCDEPRNLSIIQRALNFLLLFSFLI